MQQVMPKRTNFHICKGSNFFLETGFILKAHAKQNLPQDRTKQFMAQNFIVDSMSSGQLFFSVGGMTSLQHKIGA